MANRKQLGVQDALWLVMDRPNNLMVVDSVIWTAEPLDRDKARAVMVERLWDRYPVFRSRAVQDPDGSWWWEEDSSTSIDDLVTYVELDDPNDPRSLQNLVAAHRTEPIDHDGPLWRVLWVDRYLGGSAIVLRSHHAMADGMRMVQLAVSLFDATPKGGAILAPPVRHYAASTPDPSVSVAGRVRSALGSIGEQATGATRLVMTTGSETAKLTWHIPSSIVEATPSVTEALTNPIGALQGWFNESWDSTSSAVRRVAGRIGESAASSGPIVDVFSEAPGDLDIVRKLLLGTRNNSAAWSGSASPDKVVAWSQTLGMPEVKAIARKRGVTINDVLVACVAGALRHYLEAHDDTCASVTFMVPVNLKPIELTLPEELGNSFALVQLELPTDEPDPLRVLQIVHRRMQRIKRGREAAVAFRIQETIAGLNRTVYAAAVDLLANRTTGILTNVPGPPIPVYLAGCRVEGMTGWAPLSGDQPMSFTIYSYDGTISIGIACDAQLVPDHESIVDYFSQAFEELRSAVDHS